MQPEDRYKIHHILNNIMMLGSKGWE